MGIVETVKDVATLVQKADNIELYQKILELQGQIMSLLEESHGLKAELRDYRDRLRFEGGLEFRDNMYWHRQAEGEADGPFCSTCWDTEAKAVRLQRMKDKSLWCPKCQKTVREHIPHAAPAAHRAPGGPEVTDSGDRVAALCLTRTTPGIGAAYLFPCPTDPGRPIQYERVRRWLLEAERLAELPRQRGASFHAFRRGWATARKHLPVTDVAAAGGWKSTATIQRCYQQPDEGTMLSVVLGGAEPREKKA
ncbi:MAG: hypothetical protein ACREOQ_17790 [Gemmatimonadales bacterium]